MNGRKSRSDENRIIDIDYLVTPLGAFRLEIGSSGKTMVVTEAGPIVIIDSDKKRKFKSELKKLLKKYDTGDFTF